MGYHLPMSMRQWVRRVVFGETIPDPVNRAIRYALVDEYGLAHVSRREALTIHGVMRARDSICSIATLPLLTYKADWSTVDNRLFRQIDPAVANVVTLASTLEDLFFDEQSWWHVTAREAGDSDFPTYCEHVCRERVNAKYDEHNVYIEEIRLDGQVVPLRDMILFTSPKRGLLKHGGHVIRRALNLDRTAAMYADNPRPLDFFEDLDPNSPTLTKDEAEEQIANWRLARKVNATAYISGLKYNQVETPTPQEMQLIESQKQVSIEIANMTGLDTEDLGVSANPRTYQNAVDRRRDRINDLLALYMRAITDRLSMGDITRQGHQVRFDLDDYLKANPTERAQVQLAYLAAGVTTTEEIRQEENLPPLSTEQMLQIDGRQRIQATIQPPRQIGAGDAAS